MRPDRLSDEELERLFEEQFGEIIAAQDDLNERIARSLVAMGWCPPAGWDRGQVGWQVYTLLGPHGGERDAADYLRMLEQRAAAAAPRPVDELLPVARMALRVIRHHVHSRPEDAAPSA